MFPRRSPSYPFTVRSALRSFVGPVVLAIGVWCAAGAVALPSADALSARIVVPPPWWLLAAALGAAWLVRSCRRQPVLATPALLSVLPWLPLPLPAVALVWTGRLAWVPVALSLVAMLRSGARDARAMTTSEGEWRRPRGPVLGAVVALTTMALVGTAWTLSPQLPGGDEPHYLIITQSLLKDGDLRIENNHQARDYASYFHGPLSPDFLHRGRNEVIYSIHAPGLPLIVAPMFAAFGYRGAQATVMACAVITGVLVWTCGWLATRSTGAAWFAWAAVVSSVTFLVQGVSIFPDGPAATILAASTLVLLWLQRRLAVSRLVLVGLSAALAVLPFLHTRLATVSAGVGAAVVWSLATEAGRSSVERRHRILLFLALPLAGLVAWLGYFQVLYGTPNPAVAYGTHPETRAAYVPGGVLGLLFDQDFGLFVFAPVLGAAILGWRRPEHGVAAGRSVLLAVALYLLAVGTYWMWWAGMPATPARFATAILPALAPGLAVAWARAGRIGRTVLTALLGMTMAIGVAMLGVGRGRLLWNTYDAHAPWLRWLGTSTDLARGLPSFFWNLNPGVVTSEWPFVEHVFALCVLAAVLTLAVHVLERRRVRAPEAIGAWVVAGGLMACVQLGWWVTGGPPLEPIGGQLRVLQMMSSQATATVLASSIRRAEPGDLRLHVPRADLAGASGIAWAELPGLPAGDYDLTMIERRPVGGTLTIGFGSAGLAPAIVAFERRTEQTVRLVVPSGASSVSFEPDTPLSAAASRLFLRPVALAAP